MTRRAVLFDFDDALVLERYPEREAMRMSGRTAGLDEQMAAFGITDTGNGLAKLFINHPPLAEHIAVLEARR